MFILIFGIISLVIFRFAIDIIRNSRNTAIINQLNSDIHYAMERIIYGKYQKNSNNIEGSREFGIIRASKTYILKDGNSIEGNIIELAYYDSNSCPYPKIKIGDNSHQNKRPTEINIAYYNDANQLWERDPMPILSNRTSIYANLIYEPNIIFKKPLTNITDNLIKICLDVKVYFDPNNKEESLYRRHLCAEIIHKN